MVINREKYLEEKDNIIRFILENEDLYNIGELMLLFHNFLSDEILNKKYITITEIAALLSKFGIINEENDIYFKFYKLLESLGFIKGNILEVGSGPYPRLAEIITERHKEKDYSLTLYDVCNTINIGKGIKLVKNEFTKSTNIDRYDTLVGIHLCEASIDLTLRAIEENKNLILAFCSCNHETVEFPKWYDDSWSISFCSDIKEMYGDSIEIVDFEYYPKMKNPILIHKKRISK